MWDEDAGSVAWYSSTGSPLGSLGAHGETQGGAIVGDATHIYTPLQNSIALGGAGRIGRYVRATGVRDLVFPVDAALGAVSGVDVVTGLALANGTLYASDAAGGAVWSFDAATGAPLLPTLARVAAPGALALDSTTARLWVALPNASAVLQLHAATGAEQVRLELGALAVPSALLWDAAAQQLLIGDQGPAMRIRIFAASPPSGALSEVPGAAIGALGGYLNSDAGAVRGAVGEHRFTRVAGLGRDAAGRLWVLNNPWGGSWDLGRNGGTDLHAYASASPSAALLFTLQSLSFESIAATVDGETFYSGNIVFRGPPGRAGYLANSVDAIANPGDPRISRGDPSRGLHFGMVASVGGRVILAACSQNPDVFHLSYQAAAGALTFTPLDSLPGGATFNTTARVRGGFFLDPATGDVWAATLLSRANATLSHWALGGFHAASGAPWWHAPTVHAIPDSIAPLGRLAYASATDTMVLAQALPGDWTALGGRVEVYGSWSARSSAGGAGAPGPDAVLDISLPGAAAKPKALALAGGHLFVSYVPYVPNITAFDLGTGRAAFSLTSSNSSVYVGKDVDSMYGVQAVATPGGGFVVTKTNYNGAWVTVHTVAGVESASPAVAPTPSVGASAAATAAAVAKASAEAVATAAEASLIPPALPQGSTDTPASTSSGWARGGAGATAAAAPAAAGAGTLGTGGWAGVGVGSALVLLAAVAGVAVLVGRRGSLSGATAGGAKAMPLSAASSYCSATAARSRQRFAVTALPVVLEQTGAVTTVNPLHGNCGIST